MNFRRPVKVIAADSQQQRWAVVDVRSKPTGITGPRKSRLDEVANALNVYPASERLAHAAGRIVAFLAFVEAGLEMDGEKLADDTPVMSYMGNGASDRINASDLRALRDALVLYARQDKVDRSPACANLPTGHSEVFTRASHEMLCEHCGRTYLLHPYCVEEDSLNVLCDGRHVKL